MLIMMLPHEYIFIFLIMSFFPLLVCYFIGCIKIFRSSCHKIWIYGLNVCQFVNFFLLRILTTPSCLFLINMHIDWYFFRLYVFDNNLQLWVLMFFPKPRAFLFSTILNFWMSKECWFWCSCVATNSFFWLCHNFQNAQFWTIYLL